MIKPKHQHTSTLFSTSRWYKNIMIRYLSFNIQIGNSLICFYFNAFNILQHSFKNLLTTLKSNSSHILSKLHNMRNELINLCITFSNYHFQQMEPILHLIPPIQLTQNKEHNCVSQQLWLSEQFFCPRSNQNESWLNVQQHKYQVLQYIYI